MRHFRETVDDFSRDFIEACLLEFGWIAPSSGERVLDVISFNCRPGRDPSSPRRILAVDIPFTNERALNVLFALCAAMNIFGYRRESAWVLGEMQAFLAERARKARAVSALEEILKDESLRAKFRTLGGTGGSTP